MSTLSAGAVLQERFASFKQKQHCYVASKELPLIIRPPMPSWEDLQAKLEHVINLPGLWITIRELYDQGYGAELETAAEIALATAKKSPFHLFATMTSKKAGKWATEQGTGIRNPAGIFFALTKRQPQTV